MLLLSNNSWKIIGVMTVSVILYSGYIHFYQTLPTSSLFVIPPGIDVEQSCKILRNKLKNNVDSNVWEDNKFKLSVHQEKSILHFYSKLDCSKYEDIENYKDEPKDEIISPIKEIDVHSPNPNKNIMVDSIANIHRKIESDAPIPLQCEGMMEKYQVAPGVSWGNLPVGLQKEWSTLECDKLLENTSLTDITKDNSLKKEKEGEEKYIKNVIKDGSKRIKGETAALPLLPQKNIDWCFEMREKYGVVPMKSWGKLPLNHIDSWKTRQCDVAFTAVRLSQSHLSSCFKNSTIISTSTSTSTNVVSKASSSNKQYVQNDKSLPLIAVMAASTTRRVNEPSPTNLALFTYMLPSMIRTIDCGYRYVVVIGYDQKDPFYDSDEGMAIIKKWFKSNIELPMKQNGIYVYLKTVRVNNSIKKPGPVFIEMARLAYQEGADYFYRVNDDTEMKHHWPRLFVETLQWLKPPYGAVGPKCEQGNNQILTHDFVHRLHMEIFEMNYYPPQLVDWWMDDWISYVYGEKRTFKSQQAMVVHHTGAHGQRYEVDGGNEKLLKNLIVEGKTKIKKWMLMNNINEEIIKVYDNDIFDPIYNHADLPFRLDELSDKVELIGEKTDVNYNSKFQGQKPKKGKRNNRKKREKMLIEE